MKIIQSSILNPWDPRHGGGQRSVHDLANALGALGHDVTVIYSGTEPRDVSGVRYEMIFLRHHERLYLNPLAFANVARRFGHSIIHSHGYEGALLRATAKRTVRLVATTRHFDPPDLTTPPPGLAARLSWTRQTSLALLERQALRSGDHVVCVSQHSARVLAQRGYLEPTTQVTVVHNGAGPSSEPRTLEPRPDLVCVARLDHHKGLDVLLRALARIKSGRPGLHLLGSGHCEAALRQLAAELCLSDRVTFHGQMSEAECRNYIAHARVAVLPSRAENFPRVIIEALHAGSPIVATNVGGIPEAVKDEREALLVPPDDPDALARALDRVLEDADLRSRLAAAARQRAAAFTWDRAARTLTALYERLLASTNAST